MDDALIQGVQKIANYRLKKAYPLMGENHYSESDVRMIIESFLMLMEEWYEVQQRKQGDNRNDEHKRSKSLCEVSKK